MSKDFFLYPSDPMQKRYEALRASFVEGLSAQEVAERYGYSVHTVNALRKDFRAEILPPFFQALSKGPGQRRPETLQCKERIIELRKQNCSIEEIEEALLREGTSIAAKTIFDILQEEGFAKLFRRTEVERPEALQRGKNSAEATNVAEFATHSPVKTLYGGVFLFIPLILDLDLVTIFQSSGFYGSSQIPALNYLMSFIGLKLIGKERLSHVDDVNFDYGLGIFAGLNILPKTAAMTQYSYRNSHDLVVELLNKWNRVLKREGYIQGKHINLDFHSIPYWGEEAQLETNWVPTRGKSMKSILSFFAQDLDTTYLCYSNGQLSRAEASDEILNFVSFYEKSHGSLPAFLVFDFRLTTYENLNILDKDYGIKFVTLKRRGKNILEEVGRIDTWQKIRLDKPTRKYKALKINDDRKSLSNYEGQVRQIVVTGTGRDLPMLLITNEFDLSAKQIIEIYALRWRIENNIQENVDFFSLNAVSSSVIVKVDFDIAVTLLANTLYKILAEKFKLFENAKPKRVYRNIVQGGAKIRINADEIDVKFDKKAFNPMIMEWVDSLPEISVPWMGNRVIKYSFE